jgi:hypothetical protein
MSIRSICASRYVISACAPDLRISIEVFGLHAAAKRPTASGDAKCRQSRRVSRVAEFQTESGEAATEVCSAFVTKVTEGRSQSTVVWDHPLGCIKVLSRSTCPRLRAELMSTSALPQPNSEPSPVPAVITALVPVNARSRITPGQFFRFWCAAVGLL